VNALAPAPRIAAFQPDLAAIEGCILLIEDGARASRDLDATIFEALGWHVTRAAITDPRANWTVLSPLSRAALPLPRVSKRIDCARTLLLPGWDWGVGERSDEPLAWTHNRRPQGDARLLWFEAHAATPALALTKAALHARRAVMAAALAPARFTCTCGWHGPFAATRGGQCPDCNRLVHGSAA
jgi:hypothetical protein